MTMKSVELNEEDSKEFVALLERNAAPEEIEAFLLDRAVAEISDDLIPVLQIIEQLQKLQDDEISILSKCFQVRTGLMADLTELLVSGPKDVKADAPETDARDAPFAKPEIRDERTRPGARAYEGPKAEVDSDQVEETKPISTDQKTES